MRSTAPSGMTEGERLRAWSVIEPKLHPRSQPYTYRFFQTLRRRLVPLSLMLAILFGGSSVAFAQGSKPGDTLFPIVRATEKAQILLAGSEKKRDTLRIQFAEKRLADVRSVAAPAPSPLIAPSVVATSTTPSSSPVKVREKRQEERRERAFTIALTELEETRSTLVAKGNTDAVAIVDDIIAELRGAGDGTVTITKISGDVHDGDGKVSLRATIASTSTAGVRETQRVKIEEKKGEIKVSVRETQTMRASAAPTSTEKSRDEEHAEAHRDNSAKNDRAGEEHDDDNDPKRKGREHSSNERDRSRDANEDRGREKGDKKITLCHVADGEMQTLRVSREEGRKHLAHGDVIGPCTQTPIGESESTERDNKTKEEDESAREP